MRIRTLHPLRTAVSLAAVVLATGAQAAEPAPFHDPAQELRRALVGDCVNRALHDGRDFAWSYKTCDCVWEVTSRDMTVAEYVEFDRIIRQGGDAKALPQFQRVQPKLQACGREEQRG